MCIRDTGEHRVQIGDVLIDPERAVAGDRPPVATAVVAGHAIPVVQPPAELQQSSGTVERTVDQRDVRSIVPARRRGPDLGQRTVTTCMTLAAVVASRSGEPASTSALSPTATRPYSSALATAAVTISELLSDASTSSGQTPHESASELTVRTLGDRATSSISGRNRAIALAV